MQFGFGAPVSGPLSSPDNLARIAVEGEAMGYDYATISDHVVIPRDIEAKYPYSDTGEFPGRAGGDRHEQLTAVAFIAGKTSRLRLVTSVTVVPHRPAVLQAKMLATIDVLSEGRLVFGIGAGWMREEFEALGVPPLPERGAVTDEYLNAFRELGPRTTRASKAAMSNSPTSALNRSRRKSRTRRSGSVAKVARRCAAPPGSATVGIRSGPTRSIGSTL